MRQEKLRMHYEDLLREKVKAAGRECETFEDVLMNLDVFAKSEVKFGDEKTMWLDLQTKKMIAKSIDPNCRIEVPASEMVKGKDTLSVTAYFYWSDCETYVGRGYAKKCITNLITGDADASAVETEFEALVMGSAITRALTDAGIGLEFYADGFDELFEKVELKEAEEILDRKKEQFEKNIPEVPSIKERKERKRAEKKAEPVKETEAAAVSEPVKEQKQPEIKEESKEVVNDSSAKEAIPETVTTETSVTDSDPLPFPDFMQVDEDVPFLSTEEIAREAASETAGEEDATAVDETPEMAEEEPEDVPFDASEMTLEEAKRVIADMGTYTGQPLEVVYRARPIALIWLVTSNAQCKEAALTIINSDPQLKARYESRVA